MCTRSHSRSVWLSNCSNATESAQSTERHTEVCYAYCDKRTRDRRILCENKAFHSYRLRCTFVVVCFFRRVVRSTVFAKSVERCGDYDIRQNCASNCTHYSDVDRSRCLCVKYRISFRKESQVHDAYRTHYSNIVRYWHDIWGFGLSSIVRLISPQITIFMTDFSTE